MEERIIPPCSPSLTLLQEASHPTEEDVLAFLLLASVLCIASPISHYNKGSGGRGRGIKDACMGKEQQLKLDLVTTPTL